MNHFQRQGARSLRKYLPSVIAALLLNGCAASNPQLMADINTPIDMALEQSPQSLAQSAQAGDARSQYALSLVLRYGLNGQAKDRPAADHWRRKATAMRSMSPNTGYVAGVNGHPGRVFSIVTPQFDLNPVQGATIGICAQILAASVDHPGLEQKPRNSCGDDDNYGRLRTEWIAALAAPPAAKSGAPE